MSLIFNLMHLAFWVLLTIPIRFFALVTTPTSTSISELPLFYYREGKFLNFGDYLSLKLVERIVQGPVNVVKWVFKAPSSLERKFLAVGSILSFATENDLIWGSGIHGKLLNK